MVPCEDGTNGLKHSVCILQHVIVPETHDTKSLRFEKPCALIVLLRSEGMLSAIDLDDERRFKASEVDDVTSNRPLPAEPESIQLLAA